MARLTGLLRRYPLVAVTLLVAAAGGVLTAASLPAACAWLVSLYALGIAAWQAVGMVRDLLGGHAGVDALAIMAIVATCLTGEYWAALVIVLMLTGGEALEDYAQTRAKRELTALLDRAPMSAHRLTLNGETVDVPVAEIEVGDLLLVRPGEVVPVDGVLAQDAAEFDTSQLTGEPLPVTKRGGEEVSSGSVAGQAAAHLRATARAEDSQYQQIVQLVAQAQESKAPTVRLADRYAVPFTLLALAVAGVAWWVSGVPARAAEVLVVATPCPLLIAAPVAFLGGMSRAAKAGIIVKSGGTLEVLSRVRTCAFDKTGTLTYGHPALAEVRPAPTWNEDDVLRAAAGAEQGSAHVLAAAVVAAAAGRGLSLEPATDIAEETGHGVSATLGGRRVQAGKASWLTDAGITVPAGRVGPGQIGVHVAVDGEFAGTLLLADEVRPAAAGLIAYLHTLGVRHTVMVTGDAAATAREVAGPLGIDEVHADCLPADKVRIVGSLPDRPVAMVGDGVNDAPVLAASEAGIAMGARGATASSQAAGAVIMVDDVARVGQAVAIGRRTTRVALESIWLGIAISVGLMGVAAAGLLPAIAGAGLQEVVDLLAILGALRALRPGRGEPSGDTQAAHSPAQARSRTHRARHAAGAAPLRMPPQRARSD